MHLFSRFLLMVAALLAPAAQVSAEEPVQPARQDWIRSEIQKHPQIKVLNNLCWELLDHTFTESEQEGSFILPVDRWVFIHTPQPSSSDSVQAIHVNGDAKPLPFREYLGRQETMFFLKAGKHQLRRTGETQGSSVRLIVRAVPSIHHAFYGAEQSIISAFGPYNWKFLEKNLNPHVNTMVDLCNIELPPTLSDEWSSSGRRWITFAKALFDIDMKKAEAEETRLKEFWRNSKGVNRRGSQGILIDEIGKTNPYYPLFLSAAEDLLSGPLKDRIFSVYGYGTDMADNEEGRKFGNWVVRNGGEIAVEIYLMDTPELSTAKTRIQSELVDGIKPWTKAFPADRLVITLCSCNNPAENANRSPQTDFNVYLDMQMQAVATDPAFFAMGGVQMYYAAYSDEEVLRWIGKLYRHYCLEGSTKPLAEHSYELNHIVNPDFSHGTEGWTLDPAEEGSIAPKSFDGHGVLQSRWGGSQTGDTFMWMKRSAKKANQVTQEIGNLIPGKYYSLKLLSGDYTDLTEGRSAKKWPPVFITLSGAELMNAPRQSLVYPYPHSFSREQGAFNKTNQYWNNYHWQVFRATSPTAKLTISDWKDEDEKGGPIGQEAAFNFVEVQPFLMD